MQGETFVNSVGYALRIKIVTGCGIARPAVNCSSAYFDVGGYGLAHSPGRQFRLTIVP
ncbi:hypothetical protein BCO18430_06678 [Burkholderia contaminans]|nr:hypothetical protein BCO18430_06678 [Burkholderia contaminans]